MPPKRKTYDISGLPLFAKASALLKKNLLTDNGHAPMTLNLGIFNDPIAEPIPKRINTGRDKNYENGNACITLGGDRNASRASGYAGQGHTQSSAIDICVGRYAPNQSSTRNVDPNFKSDACRLYISQKADIDNYFGLASGKQGNLTARSGIGMKADNVRIIGREGIKLVTRTEPQNSRDGSSSFSGIELIACNDDSDIQSMVKGENLVEALRELEGLIQKVSTVLSNHLAEYAQFVAAVGSHTHLAPQGPPGTLIPTNVSVTLNPLVAQQCGESVSSMQDSFLNMCNGKLIWSSKYLEPYGKIPSPAADLISNAMGTAIGGPTISSALDNVPVPNSKYILSKYNKVN